MKNKNTINWFDVLQRFTGANLPTPRVVDYTTNPRSKRSRYTNVPWNFVRPVDKSIITKTLKNLGYGQVNYHSSSNGNLCITYAS